MKSRTEYVALVISFLFIVLEKLIRFVTLALREYFLVPGSSTLGPLFGPSSDPDLPPDKYRFATFISLFLVLLMLMLFFPRIAAPIINFCYKRSRALFNALSPTKYTTVTSSSEDKSIVANIRDADGFIELCEIWNDGTWRVEEHVVQTSDGYLLGLHRLVKIDPEEQNIRRRASRWDTRSSVSGNGDRKVVYLHHG